MSALAEALVAAQRRALSAMEKQYVAGKIDSDQAHGIMEAIGLTDTVDQDRLIEALFVIRQYGAAMPAEPKENGDVGSKPSDPASDAQLALIARLLREKKYPSEAAPDTPLTKAAAHEIIDSLKANTYDAAKWQVPF